ncbi:MAG: SpoIIE family protein phosphatase [Actinomycetota bacterium]|nr:SpoIIE family protein phosphatase [Actinomycetota bacterium]
MEALTGHRAASQPSPPPASPALDPESLLDQVQAAVVATDLDGVVVRWNRHAEVLFGWPRAEALGRPVSEVTVPPGAEAQATEIMAAVRSEGKWEGEVRGGRRDGSTLLCHVTASLLHDAEGTPAAIVGVSVDITERKRVEWNLAAQYAVTRVLAEADTVADALQRILPALVQNLGWDIGTVWEVDPGDAILCNVAVWHAPGLLAPAFEAATRETTFRRGVGLPGRVWERNAPAWIEDVPSDPNFTRSAAAAEDGVRAACAFPIARSGRVQGVLELLATEPREPDRGLVEVMASIGSQIGQFVERKHAEEAVTSKQRRAEAERERLLRLEQEARHDAEAAQARMAFLAEASVLLSRSLDFERTLAKVARLAVPVLADWCTVDIVEDDGSVRQLAVADVHAGTRPLTRRRDLARTVEPGALRGVPSVLRSGHAEIHHTVPDDLLEELGEGAEQLLALRALKAASAMVVPLSARGRTLGAITLVGGPGRAYAGDDLALAEDLARRAALAIDNARLYRERSHIARTLQHSLLPPQVPEIPGVQVAARYLPTGRGFEVGGDFYDLFETGDGSWGVVMGDVCGKGADAASLTGLARHTIRAAAMRERTPSGILALLNDAVLRSETDRFATVVVGLLEPGDGRLRLTLACGGHPLPLIVRADGSVEAAGTPGTLIGVLEELRLTDDTIELGPGDAMLLFTDGVTEELRPGSSLGEGRLGAVLRFCAGQDAEAIVDTIERAAVGAHPEGPRDDMAILALRVPARE